VCLGLALQGPATVSAQEAPSVAPTGAPGDASAPSPAQSAEFQAKGRTLRFLDGQIDIGSNAHAALPTGYRYLGGADARFLVEEVWGNLPDPGVVGAIVPFVNDEPDDTWAVVVSYNDDGHVEDDDAADMDYAELLADMQSSEAEVNAERKKRQLPTLNLVGWADTPSYDAASHRLHWSKKLAVEGEPQHTINYDIRVLGRTGTLELSAIGLESDLPKLQAGMNQLLGVVEFKDGHRYHQFDDSVDKVAAYGIGGLIAGKMAMKVGLFAKLALVFAKFGKVIVIGLIGLGAMLARVFKRKDVA
jgi:uncharacterized membrane-anchored protein